MGILGSVTRYLKTYGRLLYAETLGLSPRSSSPRRRKSRGNPARSAYIDFLEPRVLMTTVYGGEVFQYTDAQGHTVTATLNGNVIAELVSAVQVGGTSGKNQTATGGYLLFGDIAGTYTSGPRKGVVIGNGSVPVDNGTQGSATTGNAHIAFTGTNAPNYPDLDANPSLPGNQVNLQTLATNAAGQTFTFNLFDIQNNGSLTISPLDPASKAQDFTMQLLQIDNSTMAGKVVYTVDSDQVGSLLPTLGTPAGSDTTNTYTYSNIGVGASAFDPIDNKLYFEFHYELTFTPASTGSGSVTVSYVDNIYSIDPTQGSSAGFTLVGTLGNGNAGDAILQRTRQQQNFQPRQEITGMAFSFNASDSTSATLYISEQPNGVTGLPNLAQGQPAARLMSFAVNTAGTFVTTTATATVNLNEGYGGQRSQLTDLVGLTVLPGSQDGGGSGFLFGVVNAAGSSHVTRIDVATGNATSWGGTTDIYETTAKKAAAPFDGQSLTGLTYNPTLVDPFTGELGAFMSIDTATTNLDFINHKLRINAGDVFTVYAADSDINSSIVFQGTGLYAGNSGALGSNASPANTGTVFIGYKGQIPDNSTNETFATSKPFLTGEITGSIGVMPGLIADVTDPTTIGGATDKLFAGLDVAASLQLAFNATSNIASQVLGGAFNNLSGLAISPDDQLAVMNSYYFNGAAGDQLSFADPTTGMLTGNVMDVVLNNSSHTALRNLEALTYGDPNLDGSSELYAVYDLGNGNGPTLGILNATGAQAIFTPIAPLGLGVHGKVSSIMFTPGGTGGDPLHESLYVVADPNSWDFDGTQYLYSANLVFGVGGSITSATVANAPTYGTLGNVTSSGGLGPIEDASGSALNVVSVVFDADGHPLVLDRKSGRLMDLNLTTGVAGVNFSSGVGQINPTVAALALDPVTLTFTVADNLTGVQTVLSQVNTDSTPISASSILMKLGNIYAGSSTTTNSTSLGKFLVDGTISGKVTVPGSMDLFYAGWLATGDVDNGGTWFIPPTATWGSSQGTGTAPQNDQSSNENYFQNNFYIGGDIRNLAVLTNVGSVGNGTNSGVEILALGKIGAITVKGSFSGVAHAENQLFIPNLADATSLTLEGSTDSYQFGFKGSASATSGELTLTSGLANQSGSAFSTTMQDIDTFVANFTFTAFATAAGIDGGMAFVLQNQGAAALGGAGAGLGYSGISQSAALELNFAQGVLNSVGFGVNGAVNYSVNPGFVLNSGDEIAVNLSYNGSSLLVTIMDVSLGLSFTTSFTTNLVNILGAHGALVGFTGASGTAGNVTTVEAFDFTGATPGQMTMTQEELQHYDTDTSDYPSFAAGWLVNTAAATPFDNNSFANAQFLGTVSNSVAGQSNVIHLQGTLEGAAVPKNGWGPTNPIDYFAFGALAGQTITVSVTPLSLNSTLSAASGLVHFAIFDPDGNMVQSDYNWYDATASEGRTIQFTADRPGAYRVAISNSGPTFTGGGNASNIAYDLKIAGVGNMAIGGVNVSGDLNLRGSLWVTNSTASIDTITNPSIWADAGDVGAVQVGGTITAQESSPGLQVISASQGYSYTGTSSSDILVSSGNLRSLVGGAIGLLSGNPLGLSQMPDINVHGTIGLIAATGVANTDILALTMSRAANNIQVISAARDLEGIFRVNQGIDVIRAAAVNNQYTTTEFGVDSDRSGNDGYLNLIDDAGAWNGAWLVSGPGGNIGMMHVGGNLEQDSLFNNGTTINNGAIVQSPGSVTFIDDSGVSITLDPGSTTTVDTTGTLTTLGTLTTRTYGVRGAGGVVIVDVTSTNGLTIRNNSTSPSAADIGAITIQGTGVAVQVVNGIPVVGGTAGTLTTATAGSMANVILTAANAASRVNVLAINGGTIDSLRQDTLGNIYNVTAGDIGSITSKGNVGVVGTTSDGTALIPLSNFGGGYPFVGQHVGVSAANIGTISANKAIGNVLASGVIGTITPNADGIDDPNTFEGLVGVISVTGTATATSSTGTTIPAGATSNILSRNISITNVNIGEGIIDQGTDPNGFHSGIFANGRIQQVVGNNADIRGPILSLDSIGTITLTNGSIINTHVDVWTSFQMSQNFSNLVISMNLQGTVINPVYVIDSINILGNGGILSSIISASAINNISVASTGYGILNSEIFGISQSVLNNISVGGYGFRSDYLNFSRINTLIATGSGAVSQVSNYGSSIRASETSVIDPNTHAQPNALTDLDLWMNGDPFGSLLVGVTDTAGLLTGQISGLTANGENRLGNVTAFDIRDSSFDFSVSAGNITIKHDVIDTQIISSSVLSLTVGNDATDFEVTVAGTIGPVSIGGNFMSSANETASTSLGTITTLAQIVAKGATGSIASFVDKGSFGGLLLSEGSIGSVSIGTPGAKAGKNTPATAGTGDLSGTITVNGFNISSTVLKTLTIYGGILAGGEIDLTGAVGTIDVGGDIANDAQNIIVRGSLASLLIGSDTVATGSSLGNTLTITGNLANAAITGKLTGSLIVQGSLNKFVLNADSTTLGTDIMSGNLSVEGTLSSASVQGSMSGSIVAGVLSSVTVAGNLSGRLVGGRSIASATINGGLNAGASVVSSLGDIKSLTIKGNIDGSVAAPSGAITSLNFTGALDATGSITANTLGALTVPGVLAGNITAAVAISSIKAGSVASTSTISTESLGSLTTTGDMNGVLQAGDTVATKLAIGGSYGGQTSAEGPLSVTINGSMSGTGVIISKNTLSTLAVKGSLSGQVIVDLVLGTVSAASMSNAVITAGQGLTSLKVTGAVTGSLIQSGLSRGVDNIYGTNDLGEQGRMGDIGSVSVGSLNQSIIAAGGNIASFASTGALTDSSVSSGLVLSGASVQAVLTATTPMDSAANLNTLRQGATLLHGNIGSVSVGPAGLATTMVNSAVSAGVSPGADGIFGTPDDNVNTSLTGGTSSIGSYKGGARDGTSVLTADAAGKSVVPGLALVNYTTDAGPNTILAADPIITAPTAVITTTTPGTITIGGNTIIIKITGPAGSTVSVYDNATTTDRLDTLLISSPTSAPVSVTVTTSNPNALALGRVIAADNTQVSSFTFNGDILGDVSGGPSLWLDSGVSTLSFRNMPNDGTWDGRVGGDVAKLTMAQMGPGKFRVGGRISTLTVTSSVGNPLLQQLGLVTPATTIARIAYDPVTGDVFASDGTNLLNVDVNSGSINTSVPVHTLLTNNTVSFSGLAFDQLGNLFGVASLNNQNPVNQLGSLTTTGENLHGLAVSPTGIIYAIDSSSGQDMLVTIDPVTGAESLASTGSNAGVIRDSHADTFSQNILALAFDAGGNLLALTNDRDGAGGTYGTSNGYAIGKITLGGFSASVSSTGSIHISNIVAAGASGDPVLLAGAVTNSLTGMAVDAAGDIYVVENTGGGVQQLDVLTVTGTGSTATAALTAVGLLKVNGADSSIVGVGFDETGSLVGINQNGSNSELVGIDVADPTLSVRLDAPGLIAGDLNAFAVGKSGSVFTTYAYTTNNGTTGGLFFASPGVVSTLGTIATADGGFTELLPLARNADGAPILGNVTGIAVDASDNIFAVSDQGYLAEYSSLDGSLIGGQPIGLITDPNGAPLGVTRIAFNANGDLIGLNANSNNLVRIDLTTTVLAGQHVALAHDVTESGTADASDLTSLSFATGLDQVLSYSNASGRFVNLLTTTPSSIGGITANTLGAVSLPAAFTGRIGATGGGGKSTSGIDSIKLVGTGTFIGDIDSAISIGSFSGTGVTMQGSIASHADINSVSLTGSVVSGGVFVAAGHLNTFSLTGNFNGLIQAHVGTTYAIKGSLGADAVIAVTDNLATLSVSGTDSGLVTLGSSKTVAVTGSLAPGAAIRIAGQAGAITVSGGVQLGGLILASGPATTVTIGGTLAGVVGVKGILGTANLANVSSGVFAAGSDLATLNVTGSVSNSILAIGTWIGADGIYNTSDDVIYGGTVKTVKVGGVFTNSLITAGILPPLNTSAGLNNIPSNFNVYDYNPTALLIGEVDGAESGGISPSFIGSATFSKPVVSTIPSAGAFSALVASDGIGKISTPATTANLKQIVRTDAPGAPTVATTVDVATQQVLADVSLFNPGEIRVVFNEPLDSSTINSLTIQAANSATNAPITDLTFGYFRQNADDGSVQGVIQIFSASHFNGSSGVVVTLAGGVVAPTIADITGLRSSLLDYDQNGVNEGDPFGTTFAGGAFVIGPPPNDKQANATVLTGFPVTAHGSNLNATVEAGELTHGGDAAGSSVWWSWLATASGPVSISTDGSDFDTTLSVYASSGNTLSSVGENDNDAAGVTSTVNFQAVAGTTYLIAVDGNTINTGTAAVGQILLTIATPPVPVNDNLANATVVSGLPVIVTGVNNFTATAEVGEQLHDGFTAANSVWYQWTAPADGTVNFNTQGSDFTAEISVYTGDNTSVATLTSVAEGEDSVSLAVTSGTTYWIAIDDAFGAGNLSFSIIDTAPPSNDNFADAPTLIGLPFNNIVGNNVFATMETGEPSVLGGTNSVWYNWIAPASGSVTFDTHGSNFDTILAIFTGSNVNSLTLQGANDDGGPLLDLTSEITLNVVANQTYRIQISALDLGGNYVLNIN